MFTHNFSFLYERPSIITAVNYGDYNYSLLFDYEFNLMWRKQNLWTGFVFTFPFTSKFSTIDFIKEGHEDGLDMPDHPIWQMIEIIDDMFFEYIEQHKIPKNDKELMEWQDYRVKFMDTPRGLALIFMDT